MLPVHGPSSARAGSRRCRRPPGANWPQLPRRRPRPPIQPPRRGGNRFGSAAGPARALARLLAGASTLDARLLQQLAVLLLGHPLAALLDDRAHVCLSVSGTGPGLGGFGAAGGFWRTPNGNPRPWPEPIRRW